MKIVITGAGGFIGGRLLREAFKAGAEVIVLTRSADKFKERVGESSGVSIFEFDPASGKFQDEFLSAAEGAERAYHLAACQWYLGDPEVLRKANVEYTVNLYEALSGVGLKEFVFTSSIDVYGPKKGVFSLFTEECEPRPFSEYGMSKLIAEKELLRASAFGNARSLILRLGNVYGAGSSFIAADLAKALFEGRRNPLARYFDEIKDSLFQPSHAADIARAIFRAPEADYSNGSVINLCSDEPITVRKAIEYAAEALSVEPLIPARNEKVKSAFNRRIEYKLNKRKVDIVTYFGLGNWAMSNYKAKKILEYAENITVEAGIKEAINWAREFRRI